MAVQHVTEEPVAKRIVEALIEFGADPDQLRPEATLEELDIDSLDMAELGQVVEDEYGVEIKGEDAAKVTTVSDAVDLILARMA